MRVAHLVEPREDPLDVGMVAERDRHEPDAAGVRPRGLGELAECDRSETARTGR